MDTLQQQVEMLTLQLDEAFREREMQRLELSRLRKLVMKYSGQGKNEGCNEKKF